MARTMNIGLDKAKQMLKATTQKGIRTLVDPILRRYRINHLDLHDVRSHNLPLSLDVNLEMEAITYDDNMRQA